MSDVTLNPRVFGKNTMRFSRIKRSADGAVKSIRTEQSLDSLIVHPSGVDAKQRDHREVVIGTLFPLIISFRELNIDSSELERVPPKKRHVVPSRKPPESAEGVNEEML